MSDSPQERRALFRAAIEHFLNERLSSKLDKLAADDPKRSELLVQYTPATWLADAARRVAQIQTVTHSLKPIHPEARGTNLYCPPASLPGRLEVGSHVLIGDFSGDVVGNAAALDVYKFLKVSVEEHPLLEWMQQDDSDLLAALSDDPEKASVWADAFRSVTQPASDVPASHSLAKQLYWLTGEDPANNGDFHLLAPLYASSFAHAVFRTINEDRFSELAKVAQKAKWERRDHDGVSREYPNLAVQKFGGTKPQNISQLNSERGGSNYLLASLPPRWKSREVQAPWYIDSVLSRFARSEEAWQLLRELRDFLLSDPPPTMETRDRREGLIDSLIDGLVDFGRRFQVMLPAGWTQDTRCRLSEAEQLWLDPGRVLADAEDDAVFCGKWHKMDWPGDIGNRFGNWLNRQMGSDLPLGDVEARQWQTELLLSQDWAQRLHELRGDLDAPRYIPTRRGR